MSKAFKQRVEHKTLENNQAIQLICKEYEMPEQAVIGI